jgi:hypothetical protein
MTMPAPITSNIKTQTIMVMSATFPITDNADRPSGFQSLKFYEPARNVWSASPVGYAPTRLPMIFPRGTATENLSTKSGNVPAQELRGPSGARGTCTMSGFRAERTCGGHAKIDEIDPYATLAAINRALVTPFQPLSIT